MLLDGQHEVDFFFFQNEHVSIEIEKVIYSLSPVFGHPSMPHVSRAAASLDTNLKLRGVAVWSTCSYCGYFNDKR